MSSIHYLDLCINKKVMKSMKHQKKVVSVPRFVARYFNMERFFRLFNLFVMVALNMALLCGCSCDGKTDGSGDAGGDRDLSDTPWTGMWANDPPPRMCDINGNEVELPPIPEGTPGCPDDKNKEGCPCATVGDTAACWPGLRSQRNQGICRDGQTTCVSADLEVGGVWGPCVGPVVPVPGATGRNGCGCFTQGRWQLSNIVPCIVDGQGGQPIGTVSTDPTTNRCPAGLSNPLQNPSALGVPNWSENTIAIDCAGRFKVCYHLKGGDPQNPQSSDCVLSTSCSDYFFYTEAEAAAGTPKTLPPIPSWLSNDGACASRFRNVGGYFEMSVIGKSVDCEVNGTEASPFVFGRIPYCPERCNLPENSGLTECQNCANNGGGCFPDACR